MKKSEIKIEVSLDENHIPEQIEWSATDSQNNGAVNASFLSVWDPESKNALRIDLWTKEFTVDEMKIFTYQNIMTMADTFEKATGLREEAQDMRDFGKYMGETLGVIQKPKESGSLPDPK